jgi:capsular polysaccharide transport system permease protein
MANLLRYLRPTAVEVATTVEATRGELVAAPSREASLLSPTVVGAFDEAPQLSQPRLRGSWLIFISFLAMVAAPTLAIGGYMGTIAASRYVSEYRVAIRTVEPLKSVGFSNLFGLAGASQASNDAEAVVQYLQSREPVDELDRTIGLRARYSSPAIDWWSRLSPDATIEFVTRYWRSMVDAYYETSTGTIIVKISAFTPQDALDIAKRSLSLSESLVNRMSEKSREDALAASRQEVDEAQARLVDLREKLRILRDAERQLDPRKAAESTLALAARLSGDIAQLKAMIFEQQRTLDADAPSLEANQRRLKGLQNELKDVNAEVTAGDAEHRPLSGQIGAFEELQSDATFAEKSYQSALTSLETARLDAARQQVYLATIVRPALPQEASFPRPLRASATVFGVALILWAIGLLVVQAVREHL